MTGAHTRRSLTDVRERNDDLIRRIMEEADEEHTRYEEEIT